MWSHLILVDQPALDFWWTLDSAAMLDAEVCFSFSISAYFVIKTFMTFCSTRISLNFKKTKKIIPPRSETLSTDSLFFLSYQLFVLFLFQYFFRERNREPPENGDHHGSSAEKVLSAGLLRCLAGTDRGWWVTSIDVSALLLCLYQETDLKRQVNM